MTLGAQSEKHENDEEIEDTVIVSGPAIPDSVDVNLAEANTIISSRSDSRHSEHTLANVEASEPELPRANYALLIGMHAPIPLEVPAYIGRRPSTPRISGSRMPRLVMVPSPSREVSSTHVEILQDADTVVVTDLGSTNGTTVTMPGFPPRTLRQGESLVVGAETLVDIGDGIRIVIVRLAVNASTESTQ